MQSSNSLTLIQKRKQTINILKTIRDPELNLDIWTLGLIYGIDFVESCGVVIVMTFTSPSCPFADQIVSEVKTKLSKIESVSSVEVQITFEPLWSKDSLDLDVLLDLGLV
jgi:metal-sulfur cluster biosynthetic enzyme